MPLSPLSLAPTSRRPARAVAAVAGLAVGAALLVAPGAPAASAATTGPAFGAPGKKADWVPGDKVGFGTARGTASKVWYTLSRGKLSDVYYPRIDTPSIRDSQFVVTDGKTFTDREDSDARSRVTLLDRRSLTYKLVTTAKSGDWRITKIFVTDSRRPSVLERVRFESLTGKALRLYLLHDPALNMTGDDDTGSSNEAGVLSASDGKVASAVVTRPAMTQTSSGYLGHSDGWTDLRDDHSMDWTFQALEPGNVVQTGRVPVNGTGRQRFTVSIGFAATERMAARRASASAEPHFLKTLAEYAAGWHAYLRDVRKAPDSVGSWHHRVERLGDGARGERGQDLPRRLRRGTGQAMGVGQRPAEPARLPRGLVARPLPDHDRAAGDRRQRRRQPHAHLPLAAPAEAGRLLPAELPPRRQAGLRRPADGRGRLPDRDGVAARATWRGRLAAREAAADYIVAHGPSTPQERWENIGGYSPATIGAEVAGLVLAADIARRNGDSASQATYLQTADSWAAQVQSWTATSTGPYDPKPYYLRISKNGTPDSGTQVQISDGGPFIDERYVVDPSFLDLVRLGVKKASDPVIRNSLTVVDDHLSYSTPNGRFWHRASYDGYGEQRDGSQWEPSDPGSGKTIGRGWPLLGGERGEYALQAGKKRFARTMLKTMGRAAHDRSHFMPEQVWDDKPPSGTPDFTPGEPTLSAMPLAWTHAQFVRLARSLEMGHNFDTPRPVACRYDTEAC